MAQWLNWGKGTSGSPNSISGTINTYATCTGTAGQTSLTTALSASAGDQILIHQTQGTGAGNWEICEVVSDAGATLNLKTALVNSYGTGAQAVLIPQYTGGTISGAVTGTAWNGSVGGIIALMSNGDLTISGTISASALGFRGVKTKDSGTNFAGYQGEGYTGTGSRNTTANTVAGGGASIPTDDNKSGGGGGGHSSVGEAGKKRTNTNGSGGGTVGQADLTTIYSGGAGGQGGYWHQTSALQQAGNGGGIIIIISKNLTITGSVIANGQTGSDPAAAGSGCGSGAGGSILFKTQTAVLGKNIVTASGGPRTADGGNNGYGGAGGAGRIRCDYFTSVTGSTTPSLSSAQDTSLNVPASSGFFNFF
jgi:hypothetical protein